MQIKFKRLSHGKELPLPSRATPNSSCVDLHAAVEDEWVLAPGEVRLIPTGLAVEIPNGFEGQVRPRSGLAVRHGIGVLNSPGTIDSDYRGEVGVVLFNFGKENFRIKRGERIAQMAIVKTENFKWKEAEELSTTQRAQGGFGHSGR